MSATLQSPEFVLYLPNRGVIISAPTHIRIVHPNNTIATLLSGLASNVGGFAVAAANSDFYFAHTGRHVVKLFTWATGVATIVAGTDGTAGTDGDGGSALSATLDSPAMSPTTRRPTPSSSP